MSNKIIYEAFVRIVELPCVSKQIYEWQGPVSLKARNLIFYFPFA